MTMDPSGPQISQLSGHEVYSFLGSRPSGLTDEEAAVRQREIGRNTLEAPRRFQWLGMLAKHFANFFSLLLDVSAALCFIAEWLRPGENMVTLGWALLGVAILNGIFAFAQEYRAERAMAELKKFLPPRIMARRGGVDREILAEELVPGDVLLITEGTKIPADARLVEADELEVNNAPLTGESRLLPLTSAASEQFLPHSSNVVFAGCSVQRGNGVGVVFATGSRTEFGKIATLSHGLQRPRSPLERQVARMSRVLTFIAATMGIAFFLYGVLSGRPLLTNLVFMMGIIVANVPEGLLPTMTLALSMGSLRMARRKVLIRRLEAVEALGAMHVVCTDKTGTLTLNQLAITGILDPLQGQPIDDDATSQEVLRLALIASDVHERKEANHEQPTHRHFASRGHPAAVRSAAQYRGDPLDVAVAQYYGIRQGDVLEVSRNTVRHLPFDVQKRRESGLLASNGEWTFATKGAWESLRPLITQIRDPRGAAPLAADTSLLAQVDASVHAAASAGQRVIAVAYRSLPSRPASDTSRESLEQGLILAGLLALNDPIRPEVPDAVQRCQGAGIRVILITGDHPDTAEAVARHCGILNATPTPGPITLLGTELERLGEDELAELLKGGLKIFARTTPAQKLKVVLALKKLGCIVGMTGDGVNDSPALKAADVGIAMGVSGTDVARESADVVLLDDSFASIVAGIEEGRTIFQNIRKFTDYVLASNVPEIVPYLLFVVFPVPLALTIIQILSIDLGTDLLPAIGLGQEPAEEDILKQPPRPPQQGLLTASLLIHAYLFVGLLQAAYSLLLFFLVLADGGWRFGEIPPSDSPLYQSATGVTLATVVWMQVGNLIGRRSTRRSGLDWGLVRNPLIVLGVSLEVLFVWGLLYWPPLQRVLGTGPISPTFFGLACLGAPLVFSADYVYKRICVSRSERGTNHTSHYPEA